MALKGNSDAYQRFLSLLTKALRPVIRSASLRGGLPVGDHEDVLQEVLLAIHAKRHTWQVTEPLGPWVHAIVRYKVIDHLRRRGRREEVPIDDIMDTLPDQTSEMELSASELLERHKDALTPRQYEIVKYISIEDIGIRRTAEQLAMTEGAVRVALHRAIAALTRSCRERSHEDK